jgi:hypothetical protein
VPGALVREENNRGLAVILSSSEEEKILENITLEEVPMEDYEVLNINYNEDAIRNRIKKRHEIIKLDHLDKITSEKVMNLCEKNHMIFHLPGDRLGYTDLLKQVSSNQSYINKKNEYERNI